MSLRYDFVVVGAGIIGLTIAHELRKRHPAASIAILEKEPSAGMHASGRNSGVLHSGIYYPAGSLKAQMCAEGARQMAEFCEQGSLPIRKSGKVILPVRTDDDQQLTLLFDRARSNGARAAMIDEHQLKEIEPEAHSCTGRALHSPDTAVVEPAAIVNRLVDRLRSSNVSVFTGTQVTSAVPKESLLRTSRDEFSFGYLFNAAGVFADVIAKQFGIDGRYTILPFRGTYYELSGSSGIRINSLIYPVPDLRVPFLGVHFTRMIDDHVYLGPTAMPALGREHYSGFSGIDFNDTRSIARILASQYYKNTQGFRTLVKNETRRLSRRSFAAEAKILVPRLQSKHLLSCSKRGIRAQLVDLTKKELVMDFLLEQTSNSMHVLNAVSPAFTSSLRFAGYLIDKFAERTC